MFPYAGFSKLFPSVFTMETDMDGTSHCTGGHYLIMISETPSGGMATSAKVPTQLATKYGAHNKIKMFFLSDFYSFHLDLITI